jgi:tRNA(Ile)-lysidine synthase
LYGAVGEADAPPAATIAARGIVEWGRWRLRRTSESRDAADAWIAQLPAGRRVTVRCWMAGDRMRVDAARPARRVKRFFGDAGIAGVDRRGWPVVLVDDEIVWIPGVRRSDAAAVRPGGPGLRYLCEPNDG